MKIRGWIREGDRAACGATVAQGDSTFSSHGQHVAFDGAPMSCMKNCHVVAGANNSTLPSGQRKAVHGDATSAGCPLISTLNDQHGIGAGDDAVATSFFQDADGNWQPGKYDDRYILLSFGNTPLVNTAYAIERESGAVEHGITDAQGHTHLLAQTLESENVRIYVEELA
ncbi:PAAR domain-containing protein [Paraburkholderia bannensis]|uniref:PAAR domain-containing protein n=1 Tax=Paraburkholderia bannensis TaxID=765414 RepID=UPI002AB75E1E|nr:PAAR domain-containing protein [Paraburkholderia bannensis]